MAILGLLVTLMTLMNFFGTIVGIGWILFLGEWKLIAAWFGAFFAIRILNAIATLPVVGALAISDAAKLSDTSLLKNILVYSFGSIAWISYSAVPAIFFMFSINYYLRGVSDVSAIPYLLFAYSVATATYQFMASNEAKSDRNSPAIFTSFAISLGAFVAVIIGWVSIENLSLQFLFFTFFIPNTMTSLLYLMSNRERNRYPMKSQDIRSA